MCAPYTPTSHAFALLISAWICDTPQLQLQLQLQLVARSLPEGITHKPMLDYNLYP